MAEEYLTLKHYKEPLKEVTDGFGYFGAIQVTIDGEKIQCHICGELFGNLGLHIYHKHEMTVGEYREKFELSRSTALISESCRDKLKQEAIRHFAQFSPSKRAEWLEKARKARSERQPKERLEAKNKKGTCPDQLLEKVKECADALGRTPTKIEFIEHCGTSRFVHLIYKTFGSYKKAITMLGLAEHTARQTPQKKNSDEELLDYLQIFWQENQKIPTETDCKRGLLPDSGVYKRRFGSLPKARQLAGIHEIPSRWNVKEKLTTSN